MKQILLTHGKVALVDDEDYERVNKHKWCAEFHHGNWYARSGSPVIAPRFPARMHRFILGAPKGVQVDHKDGGGLNNQRSNLRLAANGENQFNRKLGKNNTSGFTGVHRNNRSKKEEWVAAIKYRKRYFYLGTFPDPITAAKAYDVKADEFFGSYARLNFPKESK